MSRALAKYEVTSTGCWVYTGYCDRYGYGWVRGAESGTRLAHRASYELHVGPIPEGMTVDHLCFNPPCINPEHLRLLSRSENASRQRKALSLHCKNGHAFSTENTYLAPSATSIDGRKRQCRTCNRESQRRYAARRKELQG